MLQLLSPFQSFFHRKLLCFLSITVYCLTITMAGWAQTPDANGILYVKKGGAGSQSGNSWANAMAELGYALQVVDSINDLSLAVHQVWVAGGTYMPMYPVGYYPGPVNVRNNAFALPGNVKIYGGFAGTETTLSGRNLSLAANRSILSGDLGVLNNSSDNAYHVLVQADFSGTSELDGFTITGGNADGQNVISINGNDVYPNCGGAIYALVGINLTNVVIIGNTANSMGGGIYGDQIYASFTNMTVTGNTAASGGGMYCAAAVITLNNTVFSGNKATTSGGGIYDASTTLQLNNITMSGNSAPSGGAIYFNSFVDSYIRNSIIYGNSSGIGYTFYEPEVSYSLIQQVSSNPANHNLDGSTNPLFSYAPSYTTAPFTEADYRLLYNSPAINAGANSQYPGLNVATKDRVGYPRVYNYAGGGVIDMGAYEFQDTTQCLTTVTMAKTYGAADFEPGLTVSGILPVSYVSADTTIASTYQDVEDSNKWKISIKKAGSVDITAFNAGDSCGGTVSNVLIKLSVNKAVLTVKANDYSKAYDAIRYTGGTGVTYTGFVYNDTVAALGGSITYSGNSSYARKPGNYFIVPGGLSSDNYNFTYVNGVLNIYISQAPDANGILYVKKGNTGMGSSWSDALGEAADGFKFAQMLNTVAAGTVKQIRIAGGTYKPLYASTDLDSFNAVNRNNSFILVKDVNVYGGFAGIETGIDERDLSLPANKTILSGDLGIQNNNNDNAFHVVMDGRWGSFPTGSTALNDIVITGGNAGMLVIPYNLGGGLSNASSDITLTNVVLNANVADKGGAIYNNGSMALTNVVISGNVGMLVGAGIYNSGYFLSLTNVVAAGNYGDSQGGAVYNDGGESVTISNSIIYGNSGGVLGLTNFPYFSLIQGMNADSVHYNLAGSTDPLFVSASSYHTAPFVTGDYHVQSGSLVIDHGSNSLYPMLDSASKDLAGAPRVYDYANSGIIDIGAYEYQEEAQAQHITVNDINKIYGQTDFEPGAMASSGLPVSYTSADTAIAVIVQDTSVGSHEKIHIKKAGVVQITASQPGNSSYGAASDLVFVLTVNKAALTVTADDKMRCSGKENSVFTYHYSGFVKNETETTLDTLPSCSSVANSQSPAGDYAIVLSGAAAANYSITYVNGVLTINTLPVSTISAAGGTILCGDGDTLSLNASGAYSFEWLLNNTALPGIIADSLNITGTGVYSAIATDSNGCAAETANNIEIVKLLLPQPSFSFDSYCVNKPVLFTNESVVDESGTVAYTWNSGGGQTSSASSPQFTFTTAGNYTVELQIASQECPSLIATLSRVVAIQAFAAPVRLSAVSVYPGSSVVLQARNLAGATYNWMPITGLSDAGIRTPVAVLQHDQDYTISMTLPSGCVTVDSLLVTAETTNDIFVPNVFTPNGDGRNDELRPFLKGVKTLHYFNVYDQWGNKVFGTTDASLGWNGMFKGKLQPLATYIWMAEGVDYSGKILRKQGAVTLLR